MLIRPEAADQELIEGRYTAMLDKQMPQWRQYREMLQKTPLVNSMVGADAVFGK